MLRKHHGLGELELELLKTVWKHPGSTVQELAELISLDRTYARTTVLTVVQRLHAKGFLRRQKVEGVFRFWPTEEEGAVISGLIRQFVDKVLDGSAAPFLAYLAKANKLTRAQSAQLQAIVEELERNEKES